MTTDFMGPTGPESNLTLVEHEGEPRVRDVVLGRKLGLARPRAIRQAIERHRDALLMFGPLATVCGKSRGQGFTEYLLDEEQAVYIVTQSDAPNALETKVAVVKVFVAWRHGRMAPQLPTLADAEVLLADKAERAVGGIVKGIVNKHVPAIVRAEAVAVVREMLPDLVAHALAVDPRVAVGDYVSVVELLDEVRVPSAGRNPLNRRLGYAFRSHCMQEDVIARRCPRTRTWLFPRDAAARWMKEFGHKMISAHRAALEREAGQGTIFDALQTGSKRKKALPKPTLHPHVERITDELAGVFAANHAGTPPEVLEVLLVTAREVARLTCIKDGICEAEASMFADRLIAKIRELMSRQSPGGAAN